VSTLADSLVSSSSRKLPIRVRPDLFARKHRYQGRAYWVVKDPVGLQYFRFEEEEFAILQMLDGESSLDEIAERFEAEFPPQTIRVEELQQFLGMLHRSGLVLTGAPGQGVQLRKRRDERVRKQLLANLTNVLAFRFKGFDPEPILNFIYPYTRWFFSKPAFIVSCLLALAALTLVLVQFDTFQSRLPSFQSFFAAKNWLWLGLTLAVTKVLHEFGHGLSCKHFGGECHEIGVMFLVLTPCLYCNVSDSWMLPNRWHRAFIGAAGMYVEVVLASICTFIWWFTEPGPLHYWCLNVMFISSVSTILFNANPLLRYDGYYILSDIMEVPNLRQKASTILNRKLGKWCLGLEEPEDPFLPKRHQALFALYTVASAIYRWVVVLSILFFLNEVFEPYGLKIIGQIIAATALYGLIVMPVWKVIKFFRVPGRLGKVKRWRMLTTIAVLLVCVAAILLIPLPSRVFCSLEVHPRDAQGVYAAVPGILEKVHVEVGDRVEAGDVVAQLSSIDNELEISELEGQCKLLQTRLENLRRRGSEDQQTASEEATARRQLAAARENLEKLQEDARRLRIIAPIAGTVLAPPRTPEPPSASGRLPAWSGSPLEPENLGAVLMESTLLCRIGDPNRLEARMVIDQNDVALVREGDRVDIMLKQSADHVYTSRVEKKSAENLEETPKRLSGVTGGPIPSQMDESGVARPLSPYYEAVAPLPAHDILRVGLTGRARIHVAPRTLGERLWRYFTRTFNFDL
jgi:putative peptide zinc metalloprotease protein